MTGSRIIHITAIDSTMFLSTAEYYSIEYRYRIFIH